MNKKLSFAVVTGSIVIIIGIAVVNIRLNTQIINPFVSLNRIEALADESSYLDEETIIDLMGSLYDPPVRSFSTPFQVIKHSSHISVYYLVTLNNITVKIVKASGQIVYSNTVNPVAGGQLYIGLTSLPAGDYTLVFSSTNGNCVYGDFEI
jgi:hypothetical protein